MAAFVVPVHVLKAVIATMLIALGSYRLWRHRHPLFGGMQVGFRDLTIWSFLMASAHGAGLMLLPWVMAMPADVSAAAGDHAAHVVSTTPGAPWIGVLAVGGRADGHWRCRAVSIAEGIAARHRRRAGVNSERFQVLEERSRGRLPDTRLDLPAVPHRIKP